MKRYSNLLQIAVSSLATLLVFSIVLSACMKQGNSGAFTLSGRVYADCDKTPFANRILQLIHYTNTSSCPTEEPKFSTDAEGRFSISYNYSCNGFYYSDEYQIVVFDGASSGTVLVNRIPSNNSIDLGDLYANNTTKLFIKLQVGSGFSPEDSLYLGNGYSPPEIVFPVVSEQKLHYFSTLPALYSNKNNSATLYYAAGFAGYIKALSKPDANNSITYQDGGCEGLTDSLSIKVP